MNVRPSDAIESVLNYGGQVSSGRLISGPDQWTGTGVVLSRRQIGEGNLRLGVFLKNLGLFHVNAPGAEYADKNGPRFGGGTEPFVWGKFKLRRSQQTHIFYIEGIDITDDMYGLRRRGETLFTVNRWAYLIKKRLPWGQPFDALLVNLYWSMKLLETTKNFVARTDLTDLDLVDLNLIVGVLCGGTNWRFLWRWLKLLGLAPALCHCDYEGCNVEHNRLASNVRDGDTHKLAVAASSIATGWQNTVPCRESNSKYKYTCPLLNLRRGGDCLLRQASAIELEFLDLVALLDTKPVAEILTELGQKFRAFDGSPAYLTDLFTRASQWAEKILTWYTV